MYPQKVTSLYYQYKRGIISKEEFQRYFTAIMGRTLSRADLSSLESEVTKRNMRFQTEDKR